MTENYIQTSRLTHLHILIIELNGICVRALSDLMHLGLKTGPLCPMFCTKVKEPCSYQSSRLPLYLVS
jgi:hypothetical protein